MPDELRSPESATPTNPPAQQQFQTDAGDISTVYTNFCKVSMTPEELVMDFGLNPALNPNPNETIKLTHRVVMNFYTAKRMRGGRPANPSLTPKQ